MFYKPKQAIHTPISRRKFLELGGAGATMLGAGSLAVGLNSTIMRHGFKRPHLKKQNGVNTPVRNWFFFQKIPHHRLRSAKISSRSMRKLALK